MKIINRTSGVCLEIADHVDVADISAPASREAAREPTRGPRDRIYDRITLEPPAAGTGRLDDPVVAAMLNQEMWLVDAFEFRASERSDTLRSALPLTLEPPRITTDVAPSESAVVLFEKGGVYTWGIESARKTIPAERRGAQVVEGATRMTFAIPPEIAAVGETTSDQRLPGLGFVVDHVRAYVLRFVAHVALGAGVAVFERHVRKGLVIMDSDDPKFWSHHEDLAKYNLPRDRAPRILLFVHGTFSSTLGSFGALGASDWGRALLADARRKYDLVIGYDHPTLSEDPYANASDLLARFEASRLPHAARIDAVAFSRGALVLRSLSEYLLPTRPQVGHIERAVFVGSTNAGTQLARPENWRQLIDLHTNLVVAGCNIVKLLGLATLATTIIEEAVKTLGGLIKTLADTAANGSEVPGLAAMNPDGSFVTRINGEQPGQPTPSEVFYFAVTSDFDIALASKDGAKSMSSHLVQWILDRGIDQLMHEPSDLVVNTASMTAIDAKVGDYVKSSYAFGKNPHVYHTVYFTRPETIKTIRDSLEISASAAPVSAMRGSVGVGARPAAVREIAEPRIDRKIVLANSNDMLESVRLKLTSGDANWVVVQRVDMSPEYQWQYRYAFTKDEVLAAGEGLAPDSELHVVLARRPELELHEQRRSKQRETGIVTSVEEEGLTGKRMIETEGGVPTGVHDSSASMPGIDELASSANVGFDPTRIGGGLESAPRTRGGISWETRGPRGKPSGSANPPFTGSIGTPRAPAAPSETLTDCRIAASMPAEVLVGEAADVFVTLSLDDFTPRAGGIVGKKKGAVALDEEIDVMVQCKRNFASEDPDSSLVVLSRTKRTVPLVFRVSALADGDGEIWVVATQRARTICTIILQPRAVSVLGARQPQIATQATADVSPSADSDVPVMQIFENIKGKDEWELLYTLELPKGRYLKFRSKVIEGDRHEYVQQVYKEIETRWIRSDKAQAAFESELRGYGSSMLDKLVPTEVQALLWQHRDSLRGISVLSEEPFIPWELVYLHEPPSPTGVNIASRAEGKFFAELGLVRWLHNYMEPPEQLVVREGKTCYVIPEYAPPTWQLPAAQEESEFLEKELHARRAAATAADALAILGKTDDLDLFHFSGHGMVPDNPAEDAVMTMAGFIEDGNKYVAEYLSASTVKANPPMTGPEQRRPWVTLNACQLGRMSVQLQSVGGFAPAFLYLGAGVLVAALWMVRDQPARAFSEALYRSFFVDGKTLAESVIDARTTARAAVPDTWLSYAVYGNPSARGRRDWVNR